jgi:hypothetical protein
MIKWLADKSNLTVQSTKLNATQNNRCETFCTRQRA